MRISDEYAANILRTALFTVIVRYIFTSCRVYPANKVGLTKKWSLNVCSLSYNRCIFALFSSTRYYSPGICNKNLVLDTIRCIFVTVTLTFYVFASVHLRNFNSYSSQSKDLIFFTGEIDSKLSPLKTLQLNDCHNCHDAKMTTCWEVFLRYVISSHVFFCSYDVWVDTFWLFSNGVACWGQCKMDKFWLFEFNKLWLL